MDPAELDVLYQMRERLEPLALTESLPHLSVGDVRELHALHERIAAERYLAGHIRRTRIELAAHPEVFRPTAGRRRP